MGGRGSSWLSMLGERASGRAGEEAGRMGRAQVWVCPGRGKVDEATGHQVKVPSGRLDLGIWGSRQRSGLEVLLQNGQP